MSVYNDIVTGLNDAIEHEKYIKQRPYVGDDGIYTPVNEYCLEGTASTYKMVMSKEMFVEAYNKWIRCDDNDML